jgi:hypothetical protein
MAISDDKARIDESEGRGAETQGPSDETPRIEAPSKLFRVSDVMARPSAAPNEPGLYTWWFDDLPNVPLDSLLDQMGFKLAYVGIAPQTPRSRRTLRQRLRDHCRGPIATSTLRRSLTAILSHRLDLHPFRLGKKIRLPDHEEERLSAWLEAHGRVAWILNPTPWVWEKNILRSGPPLPLNIQGNAHSFANELSIMRRRIAQNAASNTASSGSVTSIDRA